jgi:hypothetical protein
VIILEKKKFVIVACVRQLAETAYRTYKQSPATENTPPWSSTRLSGPPFDSPGVLDSTSCADGWAALEEAHTLTLFYMAQCYGNLGEPAKSAECCFQTLSRQLASNQYQGLEWSVHAAALSQYFMGCNDFHQSAHCLTFASQVLRDETYVGSLVFNYDAGFFVSRLRGQPHRMQKMIARCWPILPSAGPSTT